jgi:hypothetical protein
MIMPDNFTAFQYVQKITFCFITFLFLVQQREVKAQSTTSLQPFIFQTKRLLESLDFLGEPLAATDKLQLETIINGKDISKIATGIEPILDKYCLFDVEINPESRIHVVQGAARPELSQNGWRTFLVKVENQAGITAKLQVVSPEAKEPFGVFADIRADHFVEGTPAAVTGKDIVDRWMDMNLYTKMPMRPELSSLAVEYFIIQLYSRDSGKRAARFNFSAGEVTQDMGFTNSVDILFDCRPSANVTFHVLDETAKPTTASFIISDKQGHIYPSQAKRLAPDFYFQQQVYRADGEQINLPAGDYTIQYTRGPEYFVRIKEISIMDSQPLTLTFALQRWIDPAKLGWYSGDHHIHAAGCRHYITPSEGVNPSDMMRHLLGEAVNVGCILTWGPGYDYQKQFFEGKDNDLSTSSNLMRYDLEISGFPSSHAGHLVLLRLKDQNYPGTKGIDEWPTWTIPVLKWAKAQGAVTGYAHSGLGLEVKTDKLPNYEMPKFDGIGANEYIVAVTQDLVDFISTMDTAPNWELNIWYHTLNCGYRTRISGETDFPCLNGDNVAHGRSYVKIDGPLNFDDWVNGIKQGRAYVSDGKSHLFNFSVNGQEVGTKGSEIRLQNASIVHVSAKVAALLNEVPDTTRKKLQYNTQNMWEQSPFWDLERARIGNTRQVLTELIVNGDVIATRKIIADGTIRDLNFDVAIKKSSWIALRIIPSSHTNPIFVMIGDRPIRASRASAEWCLKAVDQCWSQKAQKISSAEKAEAEKIYESARQSYKKIIAESVAQ